MSRNLSDLVDVRSEFARSANVERDSGRVNPGYVPTARAREVIRRITAALDAPGAGRALSITGTYGSGKSSLAVFLSALFGPMAKLRQEASAVLAMVDPRLAEDVESALTKLPSGGMLIAMVTAKREPVADTVVRALVKAVSTSGVKPQLRRSVDAIAVRGHAQADEVLDCVRRITEQHGLLLLIDEFGKNIEEFLKSGEPGADLFLLQELAEWSARTTEHPAVLLLMQHLAFADYDNHGTGGREWAKVQGRFSDIPYVESAGESQALMASVFRKSTSVDSWAEEQKLALDEVGMADLLHISMQEVFPLHPVTAVVLPDLCYRYGQNERTLFAFLAGPDPSAVPDVLGSLTVRPGTQVPSVRLHHVYDYFLASAPSMVTNSPHAARWIEIETRIRDAAGLEAGDIRLLKTIAVLNLVSAGGVARASRPVIRHAVADRQSGTEDAAAVDAAITRLIDRGYVTYREFADEFRIWSGTDYDVQSVVEASRRFFVGESPAKLLNAIRPQIPVVAARHSQRTGVLRVFDRLFVDPDSPQLATEMGQDYDGLVLLCIGDSKMVLQRDDVATISATRPVVIGTAADPGLVAEVALNLAAHHEALKQSEITGADWVAQRELRERVSAATAALDVVVDDLNSGTQMNWRRVVDGRSFALASSAAKPLPSVLSTLCDLLYPDTPIVRNEMLSRRVLTSQGARARRNLLEAMLSEPDSDRCGIEGYPPERAMYEALLGSTGIHRRRSGILDFGAPPADNRFGYAETWSLIETCFQEAGSVRVGLRDIYLRLMQPPVGLKEGPIPILLAAALIKHADDVAIYEDGTFVPRLDVTILERMIRNPEMFAVQSYVLRGPRRQMAAAIVDRLRASTVTPRHTRLPSVVTAVGPLLTRMRSLPEYSLKTKGLSAKASALRKELLEAREPDRLLFRDIPKSLGYAAVGVREGSGADVSAVVPDLFKCLSEIEGTHTALLKRIRRAVVDALATESKDTRGDIKARFSALRNAQVDSDTRTLAAALLDEHLDDDEWLSYLGMIAIGKPTQSWSDVDADTAIARLESDLRRIRNLESLPVEAKPGHRAVRLALTEQDGFDDHRVVWVSESQAGRLREIAAAALAQARQDLGGNADEALLAEMALALLRPGSTVRPARQSGSAKTRRK